MMRTRTIQAAVVALGLAASAPIAHAGGGGAGSPVPGAMFDCYLINSGDNPPQVLTMDDQFHPDGRTGVKLGKAKLLCTPANGIGGVRTAPAGRLLGGHGHQVLRDAAQRRPPESQQTDRRSVCCGHSQSGRAAIHLCPGLQVRRGSALRARLGVRLSRRSLLRGGVLALGVEPRVVLGPLWWRVQGSDAHLVGQVHAAPPSSRLSDPELEDLVAFAELLVEGRALSPVERDFLVGSIADHVAREPDYLGLCRTTVSLLRRLAGRRFSSLDMTKRIELMTRHRLNSVLTHRRRMTSVPSPPPRARCGRAHGAI